MKNLWIENCSIADIVKGNHFLDVQKTILIQIVDVGTRWPEPKFKKEFRNIFKFQFDDVDKETDDNKISEEDAKLLAQRLQDAFDNNLNVVVHCHAGLCRSGAVTEVGLMMGFQETGKLRIPNIFVKNMIRKHLFNEN